MKLSMRGIYKSFGANDVLRNVDFHLNEGEICALLGENGAGKSLTAAVSAFMCPMIRSTPVSRLSIRS